MLPLTNTLGLNSLFVAHVTLAAVAALWRIGSGDAASILTQVGEMFAHIDGVVDGDGACARATNTGKVSKITRTRVRVRETAGLSRGDSPIC